MSTESDRAPPRPPAARPPRGDKKGTGPRRLLAPTGAPRPLSSLDDWSAAQAPPPDVIRGSDVAPPRPGSRK